MTAIAQRFYAEMLRIRMVEEEIAARYPAEKMRNPMHLSIGQEAVAVGVSATLRPSDQVVSTHRCHAHYLAKGGDLKAMLCELMGREPGCCSGRGGSMHLFDPEVGVLYSGPIVGSSIPVGVGAALAIKRGAFFAGDDGVVVVYLGDAAVEEGVFHESANFAVLHKLPVVFVCENNLYSVHTPLHVRQPARSLADLARGHGLKSRIVNGNDVFEVRNRAGEAVARARSGRGPSFLQANTYRWRAHVGPKDDSDRPEFAAWKLRDPLQCTFKPNDQILADMRQRISVEIAEAFVFAEAAPFPCPKTVAEHVYAADH